MLLPLENPKSAFNLQRGLLMCGEGYCHYLIKYMKFWPQIQEPQPKDAQSQD